MYKVPANTVFLAKKVHYLPSCHSTNAIAAELVKKGAQDGTVVITDDQFAGRGQLGNTWESEVGSNLTFSIIHFPHALPAARQFELIKAVTLGITDHLQSFLNVRADIKWPNDICYGDKKIAGILINTSLNHGMIDDAIMGIGLNVNQDKFKVAQASSLRNITGREYSLQTTLEGLLLQIENRLLQLVRGERQKLHVDYLHRLYGINEPGKFEIVKEQREIEGIIRGIDDHGKLKVECGGSILWFNFKEVKFL